MVVHKLPYIWQLQRHSYNHSWVVEHQYGLVPPYLDPFHAVSKHEGLSVGWFPQMETLMKSFSTHLSFWWIQYLVFWNWILTYWFHSKMDSISNNLRWIIEYCCHHKKTCQVDHNNNIKDIICIVISSNTNLFQCFKTLRLYY